LLACGDPPMQQCQTIYRHLEPTSTPPTT
jgi:hypothetical protein